MGINFQEGNWSNKILIAIIITLIVGGITGFVIGLKSAPTITTTKMVTSKVTETKLTTTTFFQTVIKSTTLTEVIALMKDIEVSPKAPVNAEWITEDGLLKISAKIFFNEGGWPRELFPSYYKVKMNITNISNEPISRILVIIFPYRGRAYCGDTKSLYHHMIKILHPGQQETIEFPDIKLEDITSIKVAIFALEVGE